MSRQRPRDYWNKETIKAAFYELREKLGRTPINEEFPNGALFALRHNKYAPGVTTWNGLLKDLHEEINNDKDYWKKETITQAFYELKDELGRTPRAIEFIKKYGGPVWAIRKGKYDPNIRTWTGFLKSLNEKINLDRDIWNKQTIRRAFYELKKKLGKKLTQEDMPGGILGAITKGRYDPNIKTWNEFLKDIGERITHSSKRVSISLLEDIASAGETQ